MFSPSLYFNHSLFMPLSSTNHFLFQPLTDTGVFHFSLFSSSLFFSVETWVHFLWKYFHLFEIVNKRGGNEQKVNGSTHYTFTITLLKRTRCTEQMNWYLINRTDTILLATMSKTMFINLSYVISIWHNIQTIFF